MWLRVTVVTICIISIIINNKKHFLLVCVSITHQVYWEEEEGEGYTTTRLHCPGQLCVSLLSSPGSFLRAPNWKLFLTVQSGQQGQRRYSEIFWLRATQLWLPFTIKQSVGQNYYVCPPALVMWTIFRCGWWEGETKIIQSPYFIKISLEVSHLILPLEDQNTCRRVTLSPGLSFAILSLACILSSLLSPSFLPDIY